MPLPQTLLGLGPCTQAILPCLLDMGTPQGHARQASLERRLACIAAAPWTRLAAATPPVSKPAAASPKQPSSQTMHTQKQMLPSQGAANGSAVAQLQSLASPGSHSGINGAAGEPDQAREEAAAAQARSLLDWAWGYAFGAPEGAMPFMDLR